MGCGESKHDVVSGNTISRTKSEIGSKEANEAEASIEATSNDNIKVNSLVEERQIEAADKGTKDEQNVKVIVENKDLKGGQNVASSEPESFISKESPNHFFSSRKDEEVIDGRSEKSEYGSPRHEAGKESLFDENHVVVEENLIEAFNGQTTNADALNMKQENVAREAEAIATTETVVSTPDGKDDLSTEKEVVVDAQIKNTLTT